MWCPRKNDVCILSQKKNKKKQLRVFKSRQWVYLRFGLKRILWPPDGAKYYNIKPCLATVVSTIGYCVMQTCLQMQEQGGDQEEFLFVPLRNFPNLTPPITEFNEHQSKHHCLLCTLEMRTCIYWPLNTIGESRTVVGSRGIVSSHGVQEVVVCCYTHSSSSLGHWCTHAPLVGVWIKALHRPKTGASISTTNCK